MELGFVVGFVSLFASFFAFASARIASSARPDAVLLADKDMNVLRAGLRKPVAGQPSPPSISPPSGNV